MKLPWLPQRTYLCWLLLALALLGSMKASASSSGAPGVGRARQKVGKKAAEQLPFDTKVLSALFEACGKAIPKDTSLLPARDVLTSLKNKLHTHNHTIDAQKKALEAEIVFLFFFSQRPHTAQLFSDNKLTEVATDDLKSWGEMIFEVGAYYFNKNREEDKKKLLYSYFRPYDYAQKRKNNQNERDLSGWIQKRIHNEAVYDAFVAALAGQHSLFMHAFITPWLWENDPIRRYFPSIWYGYSMPLAKLLPLMPNYQWLRAWVGLGRKNSYTEVIEAQRQALSEKYPPAKYIGYHRGLVFLANITMVYILYLLVKLKQQRDHLASTGAKKRRTPHQRDLGSLLLDLSREVPWLQWLHPYALADTSGAINRIGIAFGLQLVFFACHMCIPDGKQ